MTELEQDSGIIILRNVFKVPEQIFEPAPDPKTGRFPNHVRHPNANGELVLTEKERDSGIVYIGTNESITIKDGHSFNLDDPYQNAWWHAIKGSKMIAKARFSKDKKGNFVVDGNVSRYGSAEWYVEVPGKIAEMKVNRQKLINQAENYVFNATNEDLRSRARLLGHSMDNFKVAEMQEYFLKISKTDPDQIINLFEGNDVGIRLLILDALDKNIITYDGTIYEYMNRIMGTTQTSIVEFLTTPVNDAILEALEGEVRPHARMKSDTKTAAKTASEAPKTGTSRAKTS